MGHVATSHVGTARASGPALAAADAPVPEVHTAHAQRSASKLPARRARLAPALGGHGQVIVISLSLNLILLAFFIVLNDTVRYDGARVAAALDSLRREFATSSTPDVELLAAKAQAYDALRKSVSAVFATVLSGREVVLHTTSERVDVKVPAAALIDPETGALRPALPVLDRVAAVVAAPPAGSRYAVMVAAAGQPDRTAAYAAAGALAAALVIRGIDPALVSTGIAPRSAQARPGFVFSFLVLDEVEDATASFARGDDGHQPGGTP
jgi:hypothetical protein